MDTGYSKEITAAPIIYKVNARVSSTGGLLIKLIKKQTPEHMVNKIQQTISIFLFIFSSPDCNFLSIFQLHLVYHKCTKITTKF